MNARTRFLGVLAALLILPLAARAGLVNGGALAVVPGHVAAWVYNGILGDAGGSANPQISDFGISAPGMPFCINDVAPPAGGGPPSGAFHQFCLGANTTIGGQQGAFISLNGYGGAAALGLFVNLNGTNYSFPGTGNGNVVGPTSPAPTANNVACWNGGTAVKDASGANCNLPIIPTGGSAAVSLQNLSYQTINPRSFGAALDGVTDDTTAWQAMATYMATQPGPIFASCGGQQTALNTTITFAGNYNGITNCYFIAKSSFSGAGGITAMINMTGNGDRFLHNYCEGGSTSTDVADCVTVSGQWADVSYNIGYHFPNYGIKINNTGSTSGTILDWNSMSQWSSTDANFLSQSNFTARGIWLIGGDGFAAHNWPHYDKYAFYLGDGDVTHGATHWTFVGNHPYNGCGGISGCSRTDPVDVYIDSHSFANTFTNTYLDDGIVTMEDDQNTFVQMNYVWDGVISISARFHDIAQSANDVPMLQYSGSYSGATNSINLLSMDASGGNSWNTNVTALEAANYNSVIYPNTQPTFIGESPSMNAPFAAVGSTDPTCIQVQSKTPANPASVCEDSSGDFYGVAGGSEVFFANSSGVLFNRSPAVTCVENCTGTAGTFNSGAASMSGQFTVGSAPASPLEIGVSGWGGMTPVCNVWDQTHPSDITSWAETASQITVNHSAVASDVIGWRCTSG